jgi:hypothetical protein
VTQVRVVLPAHLRNLARLTGEASVVVSPTSGSHDVTIAMVLDAVEAAYPMLVGTIRERGTGRRRAFVRYFACNQDLSHEPPDTPLPGAVQDGGEPLLVVGAMAGG